jgi:hypothetical protein
MSNASAYKTAVQTARDLHETAVSMGETIAGIRDTFNRLERIEREEALAWQRCLDSLRAIAEKVRQA